MSRATVCSDGVKPPAPLKFFYGTAVGRILLRPLTAPFVSGAVGAFMNSRLSASMIKGFIRKNGINPADFEQRRYTSYNDFFTRRILPEKRPIDYSGSALISPCDAKLSAYTIGEDSRFCIKGSHYSVAELLQNEDLAARFCGGVCLIFRLSVDDYHRYCYIDNGRKGDNIYIKGRLHTVQPIAVDRVPVYVQNCREYTVMETENFGSAVQVEVGALMVGRIANRHGAGAIVRGEEKGMFLFGGSTIVLLLESGRAVVDSEIFDNTAKGLETVVRMGEKIGESRVIRHRTLEKVNT
jgi:phosphatidylserine decarboxylase